MEGRLSSTTWRHVPSGVWRPDAPERPTPLPLPPLEEPPEVPRFVRERAELRRRRAGPADPRAGLPLAVILGPCVLCAFLTGPLSHAALFLAGNTPRYYALGVAGPSIHMV